MKCSLTISSTGFQACAGNFSQELCLNSYLTVCVANDAVCRRLIQRSPNLPGRLGREFGFSMKIRNCRRRFGGLRVASQSRRVRRWSLPVALIDSPCPRAMCCVSNCESIKALISSEFCRAAIDIRLFAIESEHDSP